MKDNHEGASPPPDAMKPTQLAIELLGQGVAGEAKARALVVAEAKTWIRTPYRQQGYVKGEKGCVDCSMLLVAAWVGSGLAVPFDPRPYPPAWFLHHSEERYLGWMAAVSTEVQVPQPGDFVLFFYGRCFSHSGVVVDSKKGEIVHSAAYTGLCVGGNWNDPILKNLGRTTKPRPKKFFDVWAKMRADLAEGKV